MTFARGECGGFDLSEPPQQYEDESSTWTCRLRRTLHLPMKGDLVTTSLQARIFEWVARKGVPVETPRWFVGLPAGERRGAKGLAHASKHCPRTTTSFEGDGYLMGIPQADEHYHLCESCLVLLLDPKLDPEAASAFYRRLLQLEQVSRFIEQAGSTFHVIVGRSYPALHGAIVDDVRQQVQRDLAQSENHPLLERLREAVLAELGDVVAAHPYDPAKALDEAILAAARWRFVNFRSRDLFERKLGQHYDAVQELGTQLLEAVRRPGEAHDVAARIVSEHPELLAAVPSLPEIMACWANVLDEALRDTGLRYFTCGGLLLHMYSVPRTARDWIVWHGVRHRQHHWGLGELPNVVLEYLVGTYSRNAKHVSVTSSRAPHEPVAADAWETAWSLWQEAIEHHRSESLYRDPGEAILAATRL